MKTQVRILSALAAPASAPTPAIAGGVYYYATGRTVPI